ncbi:MAG: sodium/proton-translocating pyrophosphatase, partial [Promethearchaeota archaeon]
MTVLNEILTIEAIPFIVIIVVVAVVSIAIALVLTYKIKALSEGTPKMKEIAQYIREGAKAYLKRQYKTIIIIGLIITVVLAIGIDWTLGWRLGNFSIVSIAFLVGMGCSLLSGYIAMYTATN